MSTLTLDEKIVNHKKELGRDIETEYKVYKTFAYNIFLSLDGNRNLNAHHLVRMKNSMQLRPLFSPILVNEKYEVIDGQHRLETCKSLNLPVYYIILKGYGIEEVHILNTNSINWKKMDYIQGYCDMGKTQYIQLRKFLSDFPGLGIRAAIRILSGANPSGEEKNGTALKAFENGKFKIMDLARAYDIGRALMAIKPYYEGCLRDSFVAAYCKTFDKEQFKAKEFLGKLDILHRPLKDAPSSSAYLEMIEEAYNYKRVKKVNLKY